MLRQNIIQQVVKIMEEEYYLVIDPQDIGIELTRVS